MKRSQRLQTLVKLAGMAERLTRLRLARANQDLLQRQEQQRLLESYDAEYALRWLDTGRAGLMGTELGRISAFRSSLASTLQIQESAVKTAQGTVVTSAQAWAAQRNQLQVFDKLTQRVRKEEQRAADKQQQRVVDDLSATHGAEVADG